MRLESYSSRIFPSASFLLMPILKAFEEKQSCTVPKDDKSLRDMLLNSDGDDCLSQLSQQDKLGILIRLNESQFDDETRKACLRRIYQFIGFSKEREQNNKTLSSRVSAIIEPRVHAWIKNWKSTPPGEKLEIARFIHSQIVSRFGGYNAEPAQIEWIPRPAGVTKDEFGAYDPLNYKVMLYEPTEKNSTKMNYFEFLSVIVSSAVAHANNIKVDSIRDENVLNDVRGPELKNADDALLFLCTRQKGYVRDSVKKPVTPNDREAIATAQYIVDRVSHYAENVISAR